MEEVCFITTPKCRDCRPDASFARRPWCRGCGRLAVRPPQRAAEKKAAEKKITGPARAERDRQIGRLRAEGLSLGEIAGLLGMPRSTVQAALARLARRMPAAEEGRAEP